MAAISVNLVYKTNQKQVNIELEKTIGQIITLAITTFKISTKEVEAYSKDKKLDVNTKLNKIIDAKQKEQMKIVFKEKENEALKTKFSKINNEKQVNNEGTNNTLKLKVTNIPKLADIYSIIEEDLNKLSKEKYSVEEKNEKLIIINFSKEDDGYKIYDKLQKFKASKPSNSKINIMIYLGRSNLKNYVYPVSPKNNVNESYKYNSSSNRPTNKQLDISSITILNNSISTNGKQNKSLVKQLDSSKMFNTKSQISTISHSTSITKKNVLSHIEFKNFDHNTIKYRDILRNKQQEILDVIHPSLNRITVPYQSEEDKRLYEYSKDKQKWMDKKGFKLATSLFAARKLPVISNYVGASPSEPPVNYSFREIDKKRWVSKKGFRVC
jgi:hypothetical protein